MMTILGLTREDMVAGLLIGFFAVFFAVWAVLEIIRALDERRWARERRERERRQAELDATEDVRLWSCARILHELRAGTRPWWLRNWGAHQELPEDLLLLARDNGRRILDPSWGEREAERAKRARLREAKERHVVTGVGIPPDVQAELDRLERAGDPILTTRERLFGRELGRELDARKMGRARGRPWRRRDEPAADRGPEERTRRAFDGAGAGPLGIVTVFGTSGGAGKTFLAANLAAAVAQVTRQDTAVVDLDLDFGDLLSYFGREPSTTVDRLMSASEGTPPRLREVAVEVAPHVFAFGAPPDPATEPPPAEAIGAFLDAVRREFDHVIVDTWADYSDQAMTCFELSDAICVLVHLDPVTIRQTSKALAMLESLGVPRDRFRVVVNRARSDVALDTEDVESSMGMEVVGCLPLSSRAAGSSSEKGVPVVIDAPVSDLAMSIVRLAETLPRTWSSRRPA